MATYLVHIIRSPFASSESDAPFSVQPFVFFLLPAAVWQRYFGLWPCSPFFTEFKFNILGTGSSLSLPRFFCLSGLEILAAVAYRLERHIGGNATVMWVTSLAISAAATEQHWRLPTVRPLDAAT